MIDPQRIEAILDILEKTHQPTMLEQLSHYTPYQLLVMTLLSARSKDSTVIPIVKEFFAKYPTPQDVATLDLETLEKWFYRIGFYKTKAKHVKRLSQQVIEEFGSEIPQDRDALMSLPGVGRKTANCILSYTFNKPAIAVDIHVHRICNTTRLAWIDTQTPFESEQALMELVPLKRWNDINKLIVDHGQRICHPIKPECDKCPITQFCQYP